MSSLNDLFEKILQSEQSFKERLDKSRELSCRIQEYQSQLKSIREFTVASEGELIVKSQILADTQTEAKVQAVRRDVFAAQAMKLHKQQEAMKRKAEEASNYLSEERRAIVTNMNEFSQSYDLCGFGAGYREDVARAQIKAIQSETFLTSSELVKMKLQNEEIERLKSEIQEIELKLNAERMQEKELNGKLAELNRQWTILEQEKESISNKFLQEPELAKIQSELSSYLSHCSEEEECQALEKELEALQRQCYQKQMKQQLTLQQKGWKNNPESNFSSTYPGVSAWIDDEAIGHFFDVEQREEILNFACDNDENDDKRKLIELNCDELEEIEKDFDIMLTDTKSKPDQSPSPAKALHRASQHTPATEDLPTMPSDDSCNKIVLAASNTRSLKGSVPEPRTSSNSQLQPKRMRFPSIYKPPGHLGGLPNSAKRVRFSS